MKRNYTTVRSRRCQKKGKEGLKPSFVTVVKNGRLPVRNASGRDPLRKTASQGPGHPRVPRAEAVGGRDDPTCPI